VKDIWDSFKDNSKDDGKTEENSNGLMPLLNILEEYIHPIRFAIQFYNITQQKYLADSEIIKDFLINRLVEVESTLTTGLKRYVFTESGNDPY
jgi:hypothetical protein